MHHVHIRKRCTDRTADYYSLGWPFACLLQYLHRRKSYHYSDLSKIYSILEQFLCYRAPIKAFSLTSVFET